MINGIIFDFNGTILWDTELHNYAWDRFLDNHNIVLSDKEKDVVIHGKSNYEIFRALFGKKIGDSEVNRLSEEKESLYRKLCMTANLQLADGCIELFEQCNKRKIPIAIATSSLRENVDFYITTFHLKNWFTEDTIIYSDGKIKSKPDPEMFNIAAERLKVNTENVIIFEDSFAGIKAAENAKAGEIIIVNSSKNNYYRSNYKVITSFREIDLEEILS